MVSRFLYLAVCLTLPAGMCFSTEHEIDESPEISDLERKIRLLLQLPAGEESSPSESPGLLDEQTREKARAILKEFRRELFPAYQWINFAAGEVAFGYQRNVLKEEVNPVDSSYLTGNVEASLTLLRNRHPMVNLYTIAERREFLEQSDIPPEDLVLLYSNLAAGRDLDTLFTVESTAFYVRQVMEDPLQEGAPSLFSLWNVRIRTGVQLERLDHSLFLGHVYYQEWYEEEKLDYSAGGLFLRWKWKLGASLELKSDLEYAPRNFDERVSRERNGLPIEDSLLRLDRLFLESRLIWKPSPVWINKVTTGFQVTREWSEESEYDTNVLVQLVNQLEFSWKDITFGPSLKASFRDYDHRQISFSEAEQQEQWRWSVVFSAAYALNAAMVLEARYESETADSNRDNLDYRSDSFQITANYTF